MFDKKKEQEEKNNRITAYLSLKKLVIESPIVYLIITMPLNSDIWYASLCYRE